MAHKHLTNDDRLQIEAWLKAKVSIKEIAGFLGVHISTVYREVQKGQYTHKNTDWTMGEKYGADVAQRKYEEHLRNKGRALKIEADPELAAYIERKIGEEHYSPEAVVWRIKKKGLVFKISVCANTIYNYIERGVFENLTVEYLPVPRKKKKVKRTVEKKKRARVARGESIEKRPAIISYREELGHWEMDCVVGPQGKSKKVMLVFTERKSREVIIELLPDHTTASVVAAIDRIERRCGAFFRVLFKSITVDNGSEFSDCEGIEKARRVQGKRTRLFYCHPYSSHERGSNENCNRLIRRWIPKGMNFDNKTVKEIKAIEAWINDYPRRQFGFDTAEEVFQREVEKLLSG